jgi:hypothetical protein
LKALTIYSHPLALFFLTPYLLADSALFICTRL